MGNKLHIVQNEKLVMFGVPHVLSVDGFSSKTVSHSTMQVKNLFKINNHKQYKLFGEVDEAIKPYKKECSAKTYVLNTPHPLSIQKWIMLFEVSMEI